MTTRENGSVVINLKDKENDLPRNASGDVEFANLEDVQDVFSDEEITVLVNRAIYHMEYQKNHHKKYTQKQRDMEAPVKAAAKRLFPGIAWINLTEEQYKVALLEAYPSAKGEEC